MGKPVIVLSNNDGCVIARSNEAKILGIKMGEPFFKISALCHRYHVYVFSSNFALYGDLSKRVMNTLNTLWPDMEIYSIDEAFLKLDALACDPFEYAKTIRQTVWQNTGLITAIDNLLKLI
jgi:DNA polymerase V